MTKYQENAPKQMTFPSTSAALDHQQREGGWVFVPETGVDSFWFSGRAFTPSTIMTHPLTSGMSGKIL